MGSKSYEQFCGLARALDVVGQRWTLLVVRELLVGPARYSELAAALPGVASNLLADRLRSLEAAGVVERRLDPGSSTVRYALTAWGAQLRDAVDGLVRWSTPLMQPGRGTDAFRPQWLAVALRALLQGRSSAPPATVGLDVDGVTLTVHLDETGAQVTVDPDPQPATVLRAVPDVVLGLAAGALSVDEVVARGTLRGDAAELTRVFGGQDGSGAGAPSPASPARNPA